MLWVHCVTQHSHQPGGGYSDPWEEALEGKGSHSIWQAGTEAWVSLPVQYSPFPGDHTASIGHLVWPLQPPGKEDVYSSDGETEAQSESSFL